MAGGKNNTMKKGTFLSIVGMMMLIIGILLLLEFPQTAWGLGLSLIGTALFGAGMAKLEKEIRRHDFKNRNK
jgi:hypothetical protein